MIITPHNCIYYESHDNLNKTCKLKDKRCVLISDQKQCCKFTVRKDLGFWDIQGNYIEDIQEITMEEEIELLRQENAELKAENERLKENDCEQCKHLDLYIKYKQTLQEIKEIIEECKNENCIDCKYKDECDCDAFTFILQKISDCEV